MLKVRFPSIFFPLPNPALTFSTTTGRTLKQITDSTGCAIQIPPSTGSLTEDPDTLIPISLSGPASSVNHARAQIQALVAQRAAKASVSIHIDPLYLGLLKNRIEEKQLGAVEEVIVDVPEVKSGTSFGGVDVLEFEDVVGSAGKKNENVGKIVVTGERDVVNSVVEQIQAELTDLVRFLSLLFSLIRAICSLRLLLCCTRNELLKQLQSLCPVLNIVF